MRPCIMGLILVSSVCSSSSWGRGGGVLAVVCHITATAPSEPCRHVMLCHIFYSSIHHTLTLPVYGTSGRVLSPPSFLVWSEPELSVCIHPTVPTLALLHRQHCPSRHAAETRRQQSLITIIATQVLAQQTRRAPQLLFVYHHHNIQMINESQAVT